MPVDEHSDDGSRRGSRIPSLLPGYFGGTGGVILFAKSAWACRLLGEALAAPDTEKTYLAAVYGVPSPPSGRIDLPIRRPDPRDLRRETSPR